MITSYSATGYTTNIYIAFTCMRFICCFPFLFNFPLQRLNSLASNRKHCLCSDKPTHSPPTATTQHSSRVETVFEESTKCCSELNYQLSDTPFAKYGWHRTCETSEGGSVREKQQRLNEVRVQSIPCWTHRHTNTDVSWSIEIGGPATFVINIIEDIRR